MQSSDSAPAMLSSATANASASTVELEYDGPAPAGEFAVTVNGATVAIVDVLRDDSTVTLFLPDGALQVGDEVVVAWQGGSAQLTAQ